jgi:hypothetical protein
MQALRMSLAASCNEDEIRTHVRSTLRVLITKCRQFLPP